MKKNFIHCAIAVLLLSLSSVASQELKYTKEQIAANKKLEHVNKLLEAKKYKEALPLVQELVAAAPYDWELYEVLGGCFYLTGDYEKALVNYQKGIQLAENIATDPKTPLTDPEKQRLGILRMLIYEGHAYSGMEKNTEAIQAYTKAIEMAPNSAEAYLSLCGAQYNHTVSQEVLDICEKAIALDPANPEGYFLKGSLLLDMSDIDDYGMTVTLPGTVEALKKYLELAPSGEYVNQVKQLLSSIRLSAADIERLLQGGKAPTNAAELVQQRGVDFTLDNPTKARLRKAGATDELLLAIAKAVVSN